MENLLRESTDGEFNDVFQSNRFGLNSDLQTTKYSLNNIQIIGALVSSESAVQKVRKVESKPSLCISRRNDRQACISVTLAEVHLLAASCCSHKVPKKFVLSSYKVHTKFICKLTNKFSFLDVIKFADELYIVEQRQARLTVIRAFIMIVQRGLARILAKTSNIRLRRVGSESSVKTDLGDQRISFSPR